jgi:dTDP-4-dehydrorhamnose 3,5-epimerase
MKFAETPLTGSYVIDLDPFNDERGWFVRIFCKNEFQQIGHGKEWVQINHSATYKQGSIRGMHFQLPPYREIKMVRCIAGSVYDVIIDLRRNSDSFLKWFGIELSARNKKMLYIPEGFAHGFQALQPDSELIYHHTEFYTATAESGVKYNDPAVNIQWPLAVTMISERDSGFPYLDKNFKGI